MKIVTYVYERLLLHCPYLSARRYLRERLPAIAPKALSGGGLIAKVSVTYTRAADPLRFHEPWLVSWSSDGAAGPDFCGELYVRLGDGGPVLELAGNYAPPYEPDQRIDIMAGSKRAATVARTLLVRIAVSMEELARSEAFKKARMPA